MRFFMLLVVGFVCSQTALSLQGAEGDWNQFRGSTADGRSTATGLPKEFGEEKSIVWKTAIEGKGWSSPVVWGKQIWLTTAPPDGTKLKAICLDVESGERVHDILVFDNPDPQFCHDMNSYATPTPFLEEGRAYVHFGVHGTACIDTETGKEIWSRRDLKCDHFRGPASSPIVVDDLLILTFDGFDVQYIVALNKDNGETVWKTPRAFDFNTDNGDRKKGYCTPALLTIDGQDQLVCPGAVATETLDPKSGARLWTVYHGGMNASARPIYGAGLVFITNGMGRMVAVKPPKLGSEPANVEAEVVWESSKGVPKKSSLLLIDGLLYMASDPGVLSCVEPATGKVVWGERLAKEYAASPIYVDGHIYLFGRAGSCHIVKPGRTFELVAENKLGDGFMASPAVVGDSLVVRSLSHVYRIGSK